MDAPTLQQIDLGLEELQELLAAFRSDCQAGAATLNAHLSALEKGAEDCRGASGQYSDQMAAMGEDLRQLRAVAGQGADRQTQETGRFGSSLAESMQSLTAQGTELCSQVQAQATQVGDFRFVNGLQETCELAAGRARAQQSSFLDNGMAITRRAGELAENPPKLEKSRKNLEEGGQSLVQACQGAEAGTARLAALLGTSGVWFRDEFVGKELENALQETYKQATPHAVAGIEGLQKRKVASSELAQWAGNSLATGLRTLVDNDRAVKAHWETARGNLAKVSTAARKLCPGGDDQIIQAATSAAQRTPPAYQGIFFNSECLRQHGLSYSGAQAGLEAKKRQDQAAAEAARQRANRDTSPKR